MKYTDQMFSFPVRIYTRKDYMKFMANQDKQIEDDKMEHSYEEEEPPFIISTGYIYHTDIVSIQPAPSFHEKIEDLANGGCKLTEIITNKNQTYVVAMKTDDFIDMLNEFDEIQQKKIEEERRKLYQQRVAEVSTMLKESIESVISNYPKENINDSELNTETIAATIIEENE